MQEINEKLDDKMERYLGMGKGQEGDSKKKQKDKTDNTESNNSTVKGAETSINVLPLHDKANLKPDQGIVHLKSHTPFTSQDLDSLKKRMGNWNSEPQRCIKEWKRAVKIYDPSYHDVEILLDELFSPVQAQELIQETID